MSKVKVNKSDISLSYDWDALKAHFAPEDIEWRVGQSGVYRGGEKKGGVWAKCLAFINNRAIMDRLDEVFGPENWKEEYRQWRGDSQICRIYVRVGDDWIWKEDGAPDTKVEAMKGGLSDSMKRAGVKLGIGRYLYKLEATFADVSMTRRDGYRYAVHIDKNTKERTIYYWKPPELPAWALPEGYTPKKAQNQPKLPSKASKSTSEPDGMSYDLKAAEKAISGFSTRDQIQLWYNTEREFIEKDGDAAIKRVHALINKRWAELELPGE